MKLRHAYGNIYEVTDEEELIIWYRGTWKQCQKYLKKHKEG